MESPKMVKWPTHFDNLNAALAFAREYWPQGPVYSNLESTNTHLVAIISNLIQDLRISRQEVYASTAMALAHLTFAKSNLYRVGKRNQELQAEVDRFKRHNVELGDDHKLLVAKHDTLKSKHAQISERLMKAQSRLYEQTEQSTDNLGVLQAELDFVRIELQEKLDIIEQFEHATKPKPASYADKYGITADDLGIPLSECPKYKDAYKRTKLENWENFGPWIMGIKIELAHYGVL
ncbi:hypothetical protein SARC_07330 [Sphaeroforma arctica JP610]|uniref:Uncharacterized protein n=1 Tax=Sphaeroforma arctica JP610 TaxID=667725 RepID=A0A0L0FU16_9EUKA|nr:hypothetical protein SARC_07330 [Sphaeroforma arctica JP610]KNC80317.1 hypothetical protein SARC_07330 [Sphaeroforma arctica JP610]|eukprot:XP_014154219.1 hypothetical protein SARC_07330 [Sphaeroforma arctica JP610]